MASKFKVYKKKSPNGLLTVYLSHRDFLEDEGKQLVPVAGVVQFREEDLRDDQLFCLVNLSYRYGREEDETMAVTFQRTLQLINAPLVLGTTGGKTLDQEGGDPKNNAEDGDNVVDGGNGGKVSGKGWQVKILGYEEELKKEKEMEEELARWRTRRMEEGERICQREKKGNDNEVDEQLNSTTDENICSKNDPEENDLQQQEGGGTSVKKDKNENKTENLDKHERTDCESNAEKAGSLQDKEITQTASSGDTKNELQENGEKLPSESENGKEIPPVAATEGKLVEETNTEIKTESKDSEKELTEVKSEESPKICDPTQTKELENKEETSGTANEEEKDKSDDTSSNKDLIEEPKQKNENDSTESEPQKDAEAAMDAKEDMKECKHDKNESEATNNEEESKVTGDGSEAVENTTQISIAVTNNDETKEKSPDDAGKEEIRETEITEQNIQKVFDSEKAKTEGEEGHSIRKVMVTNENTQDDSLSLHEENLTKNENEKRPKSYPCSPQPHLTDPRKSPQSSIKEENDDPQCSANETLRKSPQPSLVDVSRSSPQPSVRGSQNTPIPRNSPHPSINDTPSIYLPGNSPQPSMRESQETPIPRYSPQPSINEPSSSPLNRPSPQHSFGGGATPTPRNSPQPSVRETEDGQFLLPGDENYRKSPQPSLRSVSAASPIPSSVSTANCDPGPAVVDEHRFRSIGAHPLEEQLARARLPYTLFVPTADQLRLLAPSDVGGDETSSNGQADESDSGNSQPADKPSNGEPNSASGQTTGDVAYDVTALQTRLIEKLRAASEGERCVPFTVEVPRVAPNSVTLVPGRVASKNPVGIIYELQVYAAPEVTEAPPKYKTTSFAVRKQQLVPEDLEAKIQPNVTTKKKFVCSPGHVELCLTLDKDIYFHGESISANVTLNNASRQTVKSVRCDVVQNVNMTITKTHFTRVVTSVESRDGCPVQPNYKFNRKFQMIPDVRYNKTNAGAALIGQFKDVDSQLASSTLPLNENSLDEALGIVVSYSVRVTLCFGAIRREMNVEHGITVVNKRPEDYVGKRRASIMQKLKAISATATEISIEEFASIRRLKSIDDITGP